MAGQTGIGEQLGLYKLMHKIGSGGTADVYLGQHIYLPREAAIKVLTTNLSKEQVESLFKEARMLATLEHPHIIHIFDFAIENEISYLVMEYASHGSLRQRHPSGTRIPLIQVVAYVQQIAAGLQYSHERGIVHRDIKPENMLLNTRDNLLLSDFGIATVEEAHSLLSGSSFAGTPVYMAPEQILNKAVRASDQYSLAVVIYEWLSGKRPFSGSALSVAMQQLHEPIPPLHQYLPEIAPEVERVIMRALEKDQAQRFASVQDFSEALYQAASCGVSTQELQKYISTSLLSESSFFQTASQAPSFSIPLQTFSTKNSVKESYTTIHSSTLVPESKLLEGKKQRSRGAFLFTVALLLVLLSVLSVAFLAPMFNHSHTEAEAVVAAQQTEIKRNLYATSVIRKQDLQKALIKAAHKEEEDAYAGYVGAHGMMEGFDIEHSNFNPFERFLSSENVGQLKLAWDFVMNDALYQSTPLIANGRIYIGSQDGNLYALDALTGNKIWSFQTKDAITGTSPALAEGLVYVSSHDGNLYAINAQSGQKVWSYSDPLFFDGPSSIISSPVVANGIVYVGAFSGSIFALDAKTGQKIWSYAINNHSSNPSPAIVGRFVYQPLGATLFVMDARNGHIVNSYPLDDYMSMSPVIAQNIAYISTNHNIYALDLGSKRKLWEVDGGQNSVYPPTIALANGTAYISRFNGLVAVNALTGHEEWHYLASDSFTLAPFIANGVVYICSYQGALYAFRISDGVQVWENDPGKSSYVSTPIIVNDMLYVASNNHNIYAFSLPNS